MYVQLNVLFLPPVDSPIKYVEESYLLLRPFFPSTVYFSDSPGVEERLSGGRRIERDAAIAVKE